MKKEIFNKKALENASFRGLSNKPINTTMKIRWIILFAFIVLLLGLILWGFFGSIEIMLSTEGILIKGGGYGYVYSSGEGQIYDVSIKYGDFVNDGDIVARIDKPELIAQVLEYEKTLKKVSEEDLEYDNLNQKLSDLKGILRSEMYIISGEQGSVSDVYVEKGQFVEKGQRIAKIIRGGEKVKDLICILFYSVDEGKKIHPGMDVRISPSTVSKEEYGYLLGKVVAVSDLPATERQVADLTGSDQFAKKITENLVLQVVIDLIPSDTGKSGYAWSSKMGPDLGIDNGTLCDGFVITEEIKPINLIFPSL